MLNYLPKFLKTDSTFNQIISSEEQQFQIVTNDLDDLKLQLSIDTATWALEIYEKELNIKTDISKPLDDRRSVIKSKLRGTGKIDAALIKIVCDAYSNGDVVVSFNGRIVVKFTSHLGTPPNIDDLKNAVEEIKPTHLGIDYRYRYLLIKEVHEVKTLAEMEAIVLDKFAGGVING